MCRFKGPIQDLEYTFISSIASNDAGDTTMTHLAHLPRPLILNTYYEEEPIQRQAEKKMAGVGDHGGARTARISGGSGSDSLG